MTISRPTKIADRQQIIADKLLGWYDKNARELPWRVSPQDRQCGIVAQPYHVWLSEVMLQQTGVATVIDYFNRFLDIWPNIEALAAADLEEVLKAWAGLGYYSRARSLKKCADIVASQLSGDFPATVDALQKLPGIGPYTAAAIAAIAYDQPVAVVDGNIERIVSRLNCIETPLPKSKPQIKQIMAGLVPQQRAGDFVQAMMDLGATLCRPKNPLCPVCPLAEHCAAKSSGNPQLWPKRAPKKPLPQRFGAAFVAVTADNTILLEKRSNSGLLAAMSQVPTSDWNSRTDGEIGVSAAPFEADWHDCGTIRHVFTHFRLTLHVYRADVPETFKTSGWWSKDFNKEALPTVFKKVIEKALVGN